MTAGWQTGVLRAVAPVGTRTVVKCGGSLLTRPGWPAALREFLEPLRGSLTVVVGGGAVVDGLRAIDAASPQPAELMHRLAIEALALSGRLVAEAVGLPLAAVPAEAGVVVLDVPAWLRRGGRTVDLPAGWHVTSDTIAAAVAQACTATLVLLKTVPPPLEADGDLRSLAHAGWVDDHFPDAAESLQRIEWAAPR